MIRQWVNHDNDSSPFKRESNACHEPMSHNRVLSQCPRTAYVNDVLCMLNYTCISFFFYHGINKTQPNYHASFRFQMLSLGKVLAYCVTLSNVFLHFLNASLTCFSTLTPCLIPRVCHKINKCSILIIRNEITLLMYFHLKNINTLFNKELT